jgi:hypothetical protein
MKLFKKTEQEPKEIYYILMTLNDFLKEQTTEEILRERTTYYTEQNLNPDFWLILNPNFITKKNYFERFQHTFFYHNIIQKQNTLSHHKNVVLPKTSYLISYPFYYENGILPLIAFVSSNIDFIRWIELRYGCFEDFLDNKNYLPDRLPKINGLKGSFKQISKMNEKIISQSILLSNSNAPFQENFIQETGA